MVCDPILLIEIRSAGGALQRLPGKGAPGQGNAHPICDRHARAPHASISEQDERE